MIHKKSVRVGAHVEIVPGPHALWTIPSPGESEADRRCRALESWASDVRQFFRDHRHQDVNAVNVVYEYEEQCSGCGRPWETQPTECGSGTECAWCGEPEASSAEVSRG